ncbi:MAG: bifunctional metallophosphatase/5'-nucleotidase [Desulfobacteraceae bacterium]|nr:bifunctional metallophosphatase/5'-nucleotidase [Desulfobacteraceae bacterium]
MKWYPEKKAWALFFKIAVTLMIVAFFFTPMISHCKQRLDVKILAINDFHGQLTEGIYIDGRPVGGAAVLASYLKDAASGMEKKTFIVHAGDLIGASLPQSALLQDEPAIMFFNLLSNKFCKYNNPMHPKCNIAGTIGNHEFDEGQDEMMRLFYGGNHWNGPFLEDSWKGANFPHVCANVINQGSGLPILPSFVIKKVKNVPIAFIGACLQGASTIVTESGIEDLEFLDEVTAINQQVEILKEKAVETIIVILHQGGIQLPYEGPTDPSENDVSGEILEIIDVLDSEVDVVVCGHTHSFTNALLTNNKGAQILVTQSLSKGVAYADIDLEIDFHTQDVVAKSAKIITTWADQGSGLNPDAEVSALVKDAKAATESLTGQIIATASIDITMNQNLTGESALGNLIADAQRHAMGTDFAFMNSGGIRADLSSGQVTWGELYTVQPFNNYLVKMSLTGQQIYDLLNQQWHEQPYSKILQVSGLSYKWDANQPENDRIAEVRKDGLPIDLNEYYTVTTNSFIAEGGDNFSMLLCGIDREIGPIDLDVLIEYIQSLSQPFGYGIDGRIEREN